MKKIVFWWIISFWCCGHLDAQTYCSTTNTASDLLQKIPENKRIAASDNNVVRIFVHIIRRSDGSGGQSLPDVQDALEILATDLEPHSICISLLGMDEILNTTYYNQTSFSNDNNGDGKFDNFSPNSHSNAIDIYMLGADANFQGGIAANIVATALVVGGTLFQTNIAISHVLSHELGHCLGLFHTFQGLCDGGSCEELVNGSNCTICGDYVCDTPADPQIFSHNIECIWTGFSCTGSSTDANGDPYAPAMNLIMAYVEPYCMQLFTDGQGQRMLDIIANSTLLQNVIVPNSLTISSLSIGSGIVVLYDVLNDLTVQTNVVVNANGNLTLRAGESVLMKDGFEAKSSSDFHAYIEDICNVIDEENSARKAGSIVTLNENQKENSLRNTLNVHLFPNPANGKVTLKLSSINDEKVTISVVSMSGSSLKQINKQLSGKKPLTFDLDISQWPNGIYLIHVSNGIMQISKKLVKR